MNLTIVIITYNIHTEIFLLQIEAIRKFCKDDFVIEIIDNSSSIEAADAIRYHSEQLGLSYRKTYAIALGGSDSHSFAANLSYQKLRDNSSDYFFYLDHDCIPVREFSVQDILSDNIMAGIGQNPQHTYMWPGCVMWNNSEVDNDLIDFSPSHELHLDTGAGLRGVIAKYGKDKCVFFNEAYHQNPYFMDNKYGYYSMINDEMFLHMVNASNWSGGDRHGERINSLLNIAREKIAINVD